MAGGIDCDIHPAVPSATVLLPYLSEVWQHTVKQIMVGIEHLHMVSYPPGSTLACRPDWRPAKGKPGESVDLVRAHVLDHFALAGGILNPVHGAAMLTNGDMSAALCSAINDWIAAEWLDKEPRLRASMVVSMHNPGAAEAEIERLSGDKRFVQVLVLSEGEMPLGRRWYWPMYAAAERHGLAIGIHAGSQMKHAPTQSGYPSTLAESYIGHSQAFGAQLVSMVAEGVFAKHPRLQGGADRIRRHVAAGDDVAVRQGLAGAARRGAVGRPGAGRDHPRARAADAAAVRRAGGCATAGAVLRAHGLRRAGAVLDGLSALPVRRRRGGAEGAAVWYRVEDAAGQRARLLPAHEGDRIMTATVLERAKPQAAKQMIIDCDIHPARTPGEVEQYLSPRWREYMRTVGIRLPQPYMGTNQYPRMSAGNGMRLDAIPPGGGAQGSDLAFMQKQHLDANGVEFGMLQPLSPGSTTMDQDFGAALCAALNDWQLERWCRREPRLKASICLTQDDPTSAIAELERRVGDKAFAQVAIPPRTIEPLGRRRYWPLLEAIEHHRLPIAQHTHAYGPAANHPGGYPSYYIEDHYVWVNSMQTTIMSLIFEGVFERFPGLRFVMIEGGFGWVPAFGWRMDNHWRRMRSELVHVKRPPSEYLREHFWFTTQPMEEPETPEHLADLLDWIGRDRIMFSTDYPHWDFDDPKWVFKIKLPDDLKQAIFRGNAKALYGDRL